MTVSDIDYISLTMRCMSNANKDFVGYFDMTDSVFPILNRIVKFEIYSL